ncbi:glycosyltransferase family 2 protein [Parafrankia sp. EUN1f]|uniref:glycosyltransferase family 2 protein n=1 Tax=Parafrankia sp. EUN1f TaxID=102897 RepID=UPI0001C456D0|nr:hypothetical protein [Parafrankia sp. EUN1f]EFC78832.1 hypothetical protein FrEUN1fDRAFT_8050 [Parafrankia sp. EUN1f]
MNVAVLIMTDGRDELLDRTLQSAQGHLGGQVTRWFIHDDTGDGDHREDLRRRYPQAEVISASHHRAGFGGSIHRAWRWISLFSEADYVFHLEDDFILNRRVNLRAMARVLAACPHLAQLALRRQAWNADEVAAGGIVEQHPDDYVDAGDHDGNRWLEHRRFFTTNPCLYRRQLCTADWPTGAESEGRFGLGLLRGGLPWGVPGDRVRFGFWGARDSGEWVEHIGHQRAGTGY